jgi:ketosteroid isomerase-like protein
MLSERRNPKSSNERTFNVKGKSRAVAFAIVCLAILSSVNSAAQKQDDRQLLQARETVWRAWFAGDTNSLKELVPPETIVMSGGEEQWKHQADVLQASDEFHAKGGKLIKLEFPRTEVQHFGDVAVVWSSYALEIEVDGKRSPDSGRVTEIFVWRDGHWTNPGWHTDAGK